MINIEGLQNREQIKNIIILIRGLDLELNN